jgi:23S rRNA (adenine2030-N6)-methyltransferase
LPPRRPSWPRAAGLSADGASLQPGQCHRNYPGSPFITQALLRGHDRLKAFELHPTDMRSLTGNMAQLEVRRQVAILHEDGFEGVKKFLPPPSRRALLLCDPSYELKTDYGRVLDMAADGSSAFPQALRRLVPHHPAPRSP